MGSPTGFSVGLLGIAFLLLFGDLGADHIHVQFPDLLDDIFEGLFGEHSGLVEDDDSLFDDHNGGDGADLEFAGDGLLLFGVDLAEENVGIFRGDLFEDGGEGFAGSAPGSPEVDDSDGAGADLFVEVFGGESFESHEVSL